MECGVGVRVGCLGEITRVRHWYVHSNISKLVARIWRGEFWFPVKRKPFLTAAMMSDAASDSAYDSDEYAECKDIESEHSSDSDYEQDARPIARKKQEPLEKTLPKEEHMENEDDDDGIEEEDEEEDDEMRSLQLPDDMNVQKKVSIRSLLKNKVNGKAALQPQHRRRNRTPFRAAQGAE